MAEALVIQLFLLSCLLSGHNTENVAWKKPITAIYSCGVNVTEEYYAITQEPLLPFQRKISKCNQNVTKYRHAPSFLVDGDFNTFWQSKSKEDKAVITIDLTGPHHKFYYVKSIDIFFGDFYRPGQMVFSKSVGNGYKKWHYTVTEVDNCQKLFNVQYQAVPSVSDSVLCKKYDRAIGLKRSENVSVQLESARGKIVNKNGLNRRLLRWMNTSKVKIEFSGLHKTFLDKLAYLWQHYAVREIKIEAYCHCNGHGDGSNCPYNSTLKDRQCVCQRGSCGIHCDTCCPAFNQYPYKTGSKGPFIVDKTASCEQCNCHNHSNICVYNATIANNTCDYGENATNDNCSMDIYGRYSGGGVCLNCQDNTEGINCQRCITGYYRPRDVEQSNKGACHECQCFQNGTRNRTLNGVEYLDCVRDEEEAKKLVELNPGDCLCKNRTTGRRCDRCKDGYYNLTGVNPEGCHDCECNTIGTKNSSIICNDDGECFCKRYVQGVKCTQCVNGTFYLDGDNMNGCTLCWCSGITTNCSSTTLHRNKVRYNVSSLKLVRERSSGRYQELPTVKISDNDDGAAMTLISFNTTTSDHSLNWMIDVQGESLVTAYGGNLTFTRNITTLENGEPITDQSIIIKGPRNITIKQELPQFNVRQGTPINTVIEMTEFGWFDVTTDEQIDRATFMFVLAQVQYISIPASFYNTGNGTYETSFGNVILSGVTDKSDENTEALKVEQCVCGVGYDGPSCERCAKGYYRQNGTDHPYFGICVPCNCNNHSEECDANTGECLNCLHDTTGFNCEICMNGYYGTATNGTNNDCSKCPCEPPRTINNTCIMLSDGSPQCLYCSEGFEDNRLCNRCEWGYHGRPDLSGGNCSLCQCNGNSKKCDRETGSCLGYCENNATGWHCERCENGSYGNATQQQCQACTCDEIGSYDTPCDHVTGNCSCRENVEGFNCSTCMVNTYNFSSSGCTQCNCNQFGSNFLQCNDSGICSCKEFTHGEKCDSCNDYYYGLPNATCQECACNSTGSNHTICDHNSGQCSCKPGVDGRQCDICKIQYKHFSDQGCEPCPACTMKLQSRIDQVNATLLYIKEKLQQANGSADYDDVLTQLKRDIARVEKMKDKFFDTAQIIEEYHRSHINNSITIAHLENKVEELIRRSESLDVNITKEIRRINASFEQIQHSFNQATYVAKKSMEMSEDTRNMKSHGLTMKNNSLKIINFFNDTITSAKYQVGREENLTLLAQHTINQASFIITRINHQTTEAKKLENTFIKNNQSLTTLMDQNKSDRDILENITKEINTVEKSLNDVKHTMLETEDVLQQTAFHVQIRNELLKHGEDNYTMAQQNLVILEEQLKQLKNEVKRVNDSLIRTRDFVNNATEHASRLLQQAEELKKNSSAALQHGSQAFWPIQKYEEATKQVENSLKLLKEVTSNVDKLTAKVKNVTGGSKDLNQRVLDSLNASQDLWKTTTLRDLNATSLDSDVSQAHDVFVKANKTCDKVKETSRFFDKKLQYLETISNATVPVIDSLMAKTTRINQNTHNKTQQHVKKMEQLKSDVVELEERHSELKRSLNVTKNTIQNTSDIVNKSGIVLANVKNSIEATEELSRENNKTEVNLSLKLDKLKNLLRSAKEKVSKYRLAMKLNGNSTVQLPTTNKCISNPFLNEISLDIKTHSSDALLLYITPDLDNNHTDITLKLVNNFVRFSYKHHGMSVVITNWEMVIRHNVWYNIYATRYRAKSRLTVTDLETKTSRTHEGPTNSTLIEMECTNHTSMFLGGPPPDQNVTTAGTMAHYSGVLDNFKLNGETVLLWSPSNVYGPREFAAKREIKNAYEKCVTFHGNGFIQQHAGTFETRTNSSLRFQFRTFFQNAILVRVTTADDDVVYNVSLRNGHVQFHYNGITLSSNQSGYSNGEWYDVDITRTLKNVSLVITPFNKKPQDHTINTTKLPIYLPEAENIYFGGTKDNSDRFAGAMKLVFLSSSVKNTKIKRPLNNETLNVKTEGVSFDKCLSEIEEGLSYSDGYTALNSEAIRTISIISVRFKTRHPSGVLVYATTKENVHFYLAMFHGNIFIIYANMNKNTSILRLNSNTETLNDGVYHVVDITLANNRLKMEIDRESQELPGEVHDKSLLTDLPPQVPVGERLFFAGIDSNTVIPFDVPVLYSFDGDVKYLYVNNKRILHGSTDGVFQGGNVNRHVSAAGVVPSPDPLPPPTPEPTPPPTCGKPYHKRTFSEKMEEVHFPGVDNFLHFKPRSEFRITMALSSVIVVELRALSPNGVLFLAVDDVTNPRQFVSLELVDGKIVYQFNTGHGLINVTTTGNYAIGGSWYTINVLRLYQFGAMVVTQTKEYNRYYESSNGDRMNLTTVFIGGVNHHSVNTSILKNPSAPGFFGCIRKLSIQTYKTTHLFNLTDSNIVEKNNTYPGRCYDNVQPQIGFDGSRYVQLEDSYSLSEGSELSIRFRTPQRQGVLFFIRDPDTKNSMMLKKDDGKIVLIYETATKRTSLEWKDNTKVDHLNKSIALCDNKFHGITVNRSSSIVQLMVDDKNPVFANLSETFIEGQVYIGGSPEPPSRYFIGCVESVEINGNMVDFRHILNREKSTSFGCRAPINTASTYTDFNPLQVFTLI